MENCKSCGAIISCEYYRVGTLMVCASCGARATEEQSKSPTPYMLKGIFFAFLAACAGLILRAAFEAAVLALGGGAVGMLLRWFVFVAIAAIIVKGANFGSNGRGGFALQLCSAVFFYLAVGLAFVPIILHSNPGLPHGFSTIWAISLLSLKLPFISIGRNIFNVTGLIAIFVCAGIVWTGTESKPNLVDGPFEATLSASDQILRKP